MTSNYPVGQTLLGFLFQLMYSTSYLYIFNKLTIHIHNTGRRIQCEAITKQCFLKSKIIFVLKS